MRRSWFAIASTNTARLDRLTGRHMLPPLLGARSEPERRGLLAEPRSRNSGMRVPWVRFHKTYEEYLRWEALALWARAMSRLKAVLLHGL
jgi:hypothetical protein